MSQFSKFVLFGSSAVAATYLVYRFLKSRSNPEVSATNTQVDEVNGIEKDEALEDDVQKGDLEQCINRNNIEPTIEESEVRAEGILLWIEECVAEHYSLNAGPSCHVHIKQDIMDSLMGSEVWNNRSSANVKSYVQDYLSKERHGSIQKASSEKESSAPPPESDEDSLDVDEEIDHMCHNYFGVTREEYLALEEEAAKRLSSERRIRNECCLEEKDDKIVKEPKKGWKKFKKRISKFFKRDKDAKSK